MFAPSSMDYIILWRASQVVVEQCKELLCSHAQGNLTEPEHHEHCGPAGGANVTLDQQTPSASRPKLRRGDLAVNTVIMMLGLHGSFHLLLPTCRANNFEVLTLWLTQDLQEYLPLLSMYVTPALATATFSNGRQIPCWPFASASLQLQPYSAASYDYSSPASTCCVLTIFWCGFLPLPFALKHILIVNCLHMHIVMCTVCSVTVGLAVKRL